MINKLSLFLTIVRRIESADSNNQIRQRRLYVPISVRLLINFHMKSNLKAFSFTLNDFCRNS